MLREAADIKTRVSVFWWPTYTLQPAPSGDFFVRLEAFILSKQLKLWTRITIRKSLWQPFLVGGGILASVSSSTWSNISNHRTCLVQVLTNDALLQAEPSPGLWNQEPLLRPGAKNTRAGRLRAEAPSSPPLRRPVAQSLPQHRRTPSS